MAPTQHNDFGGLIQDKAMMTRRRALSFLGAAGFLAACGDNSLTNSSTSTVNTSTSTQQTNSGAEIPSETQGPYPADGTNGPNVLTDGAVVRQDLTSSFGNYSGTASGIPTTFKFTIVDAQTGSPVPNAAMYLWHCTAEGQYSLYEVTDQNYLRGMQISDASGKVNFSSIFPGCYSGRWPHCHFEIFDSLEVANSGANARKTSQLALPQHECELAYADSSYGNSLDNLGRLSLTTDGIFSDGWSDQLGTVTGSRAEGFTVNLLVRV
jgi:protocatechuate 3,4-dioxygenase beta subunit